MRYELYYWPTIQGRGEFVRLAPADEAGRLWAHQLQLTIADFVLEVHDTHHPIGVGLYYEDQKPESKRRASEFRRARMPKFLGYFEQVVAKNRGRAVGRSLSYVDLSLFQVVAGLRYAFPKAMRAVEPACPALALLHDRVAALPRVADYLASPRRIPFNQQGIFRQYRELDGPARKP